MLSSLIVRPDQKPAIPAKNQSSVALTVRTVILLSVVLGWWTAALVFLGILLPTAEGMLTLYWVLSSVVTIIALGTKYHTDLEAQQRSFDEREAVVRREQQFLCWLIPQGVPLGSDTVVVLGQTLHCWVDTINQLDGFRSATVCRAPSDPVRRPMLPGFVADILRSMPHPRHLMVDEDLLHETTLIVARLQDTGHGCRVWRVRVSEEGRFTATRVRSIPGH